jgi:hypothetical protein
MYCANNCTNTNYNNYAGSGGSMLKKKYANKFNKVSSNKLFSLNGYVNHNYIGNANSIIRNDPFSSISENSCCINNDVGSKNTRGLSVKSAKGYLNSKISSNNSAQCYKDVNSALITNPLNKHFRSENRSQSAYIDNVKSKLLCDQDKDTINEIPKGLDTVTCKEKVSRIVSCNARIQYLIKCNNLVKDNNVINGFTPGYDIFYNDSTLFNKKAACNLNNPNDAKVIAC